MSCDKKIKNNLLHIIFLEKQKNSIIEAINNIKERDKIPSDYVITGNECKYMLLCKECSRAINDGIYSIKCTNHIIGKDELWVKSRTSEKCSIPLNYDESQGMQFCKYYEPIITNTSTTNSNTHSSHAIE